MARPLAQDPRRFSLNLRLTQQEKQSLDEAAAHQQLTPSALARLLIFSRQLPTVRLAGIDPNGLEAYRKLQPLQSNLNQISHNMNAAARTGDLNKIATRQELSELAKLTFAAHELLRDIRSKLITTDDP